MTPARSRRLTSDPPEPRISAWQGVCRNKGVQRALAVGKLAADCIDLSAASYASYITGGEILDVVFKNFRDDWHQLVHGRRPVGGGASSPAPSETVGMLVAGLSAARRELNTSDPMTAQKIKQFRRVAWLRGAVFAASLFAIGASGAMVAANPVIGGLMIVLTVYAARQAYANWRLARENLQAVSVGAAPSPMGANALGHVLLSQYTRRDGRALDRAQAQERAASRSAAVSAVALAASAAVGASAMVLGVSLPATVSTLRQVVRGTVSVGSPVVELASTLHGENRIAQTEEIQRFESECAGQWKYFFHHNPERLRQYEAASGVPLDYEPLVRWTRETGRLNELQAWLTLEGSVSSPRNWAQRLMDDQQGISSARVISRAMQATGAVTHAALLTASLTA